MLVFDIFFRNNQRLPFTEGNPVTVTVGRYGTRGSGRGYAFYGRICRLERSQHNERIAIARMFVEVHVIPGHRIFWSRINVLLWRHPPAFIRFVQPHCFTSNRYIPMPFPQRAHRISLTLDEIEHSQWENECREQGIINTPPPLSAMAYPQYPPNDIEFRPIQLLRNPLPSGRRWQDVYICDVGMAVDVLARTMNHYRTLGISTQNEDNDRIRHRIEEERAHEALFQVLTGEFIATLDE